LGFDPSIPNSSSSSSTLLLAAAAAATRDCYNMPYPISLFSSLPFS